MDPLTERLHILEEKEQKRKESILKSKQRPEYKEKVKEYNKKYYQKKKEINTVPNLIKDEET
jgi:hypothetical protein